MFKNLYSTDNYTEFQYLDIFLEHLIGFKKDGYFIEVGAYDGQTNSKTAHLADIGWSGIYVEPIEEYANLCRKRHKSNKVLVLQYAIGDRDEEKIIYKGGQPSTLVAQNKVHFENWANRNPGIVQFREEKVKVLSWNTFLEKAGNKNPDVFVLDAEGFDLKIIKSIDFKSFRPKIICVEIFGDSFSFVHPDHRADGNKIIKHLQECGYFIWIVENHNMLLADGLKVPSTINEMLTKDSVPKVFSLMAELMTTSNSKTSDSLKSLLLQKNGAGFFKQLLSNAITLNDHTALLTYLEAVGRLTNYLYDQEAYSLTIRTHNLLGNWENAEHIINEEIRVNGKNIYSLSFLLVFFMRKGLFHEALDTINWLCINDQKYSRWPLIKVLIKKALIRLGKR